MKLGKIKIDDVEYSISNNVLIIGGNNAGKTKLLQAIHDELVGLAEYNGVEYSRQSQRENYWPKMIEAGYFSYSDSDLQSWIDNQDYWKTYSDGTQVSELYRSNKYILQWQAAETAAIDQATYDDLKNSVRHEPPTTELKWILAFKKSHIQEMSVEQRFTESNSLSNINIGDENSPLALYTSSRVLSLINGHLIKLFKRKLYLIMISATNYALMATLPSNQNLPSGPKSWRPDLITKAAIRHKQYHDSHLEERIGDQSHGTRAALSLLMSLTDKTRKILFIDELELHLYPQARRYLANLIAAQSKDRQVFMVTHDPIIIDGISLSRKDFTIIKINRSRQVKVVDFNQSQRRRTSSELKNIQAIQAGFLDAVLFVEGITDRYVYGSILNRKKLIDDSIEFGVIDCGGNDKIAHHVKFAFDIGTRVAVATDFDTLCQLKEVGGQKVPLIVPIMEALNLPTNLIQEAKELRSKLVANNMTKSGMGTSGVDPIVLREASLFILELTRHGIFVVPCGELFDWFGKRSDKGAISPEWLRNKYFNRSKDFNELTAFLGNLANYINQT